MMPTSLPSKDEARSTSPELPRGHTSSPAKRKSLSGADGPPDHRDDDDEDPHDAGDDKDGAKKKRRKVNHACVYCRRSHMTCDLHRPCARCVKRDIGHLCHDETPTGRRSKSDVGVGELSAVSAEGNEDAPVEPVHGLSSNGSLAAAGNDGGDVGQPGALDRSAGGDGDTQLVQPSPTSAEHQRGSTAAMAPSASNPQPSWNNNSNMPNPFQDIHHLHPNYMFNNADITSEYNLLNDFLSSSLLEDGGAMYGSDDAQILLNDPLLTTSSANVLPLKMSGLNGNLSSQQQPETSSPQVRAGEEISRPSSAFPISEQSRHKFYMTAADPAGLSSAEERLQKLLKAKYDAGMLKPFNYVRGYARLNSYMSGHLSRTSALRILRQLDRFRPKFREAMQRLSDMQLVLVEMWFERSLMEYDRVFAAMAIPACCWRRTGEIFRGNHEMAELIGVKSEALRDGKLAIHEIIAEDSLVSYWEKFGAIAFDQNQKAILTSCVLRRRVKEGVASPDRENGNGGDGLTEPIKCCFSFTIRRDTHNIPSLIVGNFIPALPQTIES